jgi:hypothetical protein
MPDGAGRYSQYPHHRRPELQYLEFPFGAAPRKLPPDIARHKAGEGGGLRWRESAIPGSDQLRKLCTIPLLRANG